MNWQIRVSPPPGTINPHLGRRFDSTGRILPEAGNTVVCQLIEDSFSEAALLDLRAEMKALPEAHKMAFTAVSSWHMTVFEGIIEHNRASTHWPKDIPLDAPVDQVTAAFVQRLDGFPTLPPLRMAIREATPFGITLEGATLQDEANARVWRDRLSEALGLRTPNHDSYGFHLTMAYAMDWLSPEALPRWKQELEAFTHILKERVEVLDLARPALCTFSDMNAFPPIRPL
jgi:hypothetical protein